MWQPVVRALRGVARALRSRPGVFTAVAASFFAFSVFLPPALLSLVRKPFDYFAFNAWLPELPHYLDRQVQPRWRGVGCVGERAGISTGGCTVMGCGAPVIPVVGLAFTGLSSGALVLLAQLSRVATAVVFVAVTAGVAYLGWLAGRRQLNGGGT